MAVEEADDDGSKKTPKSKKRLCMVRWTAAFHAYALAAEAAEVSYFYWPLHPAFAFPFLPLQVWTYTAAMAHMRNCLEIAAHAAAEDKRYSLAILYDELCRKEWSQKASRGTVITLIAYLLTLYFCLCKGINLSMSIMPLCTRTSRQRYM